MNAHNSVPKKILIIGTSGSGKTYLGRELSVLTGYKCTDLDDLHWLPNWTERDDSEFTALVQKELKRDQWIICGNYSVVRPLTWAKADMIVWLDLPFHQCLWRTFKRSLRRSIFREPCCNGNYEPLMRLFFSKYSILFWIASTFRRRRRAYSKLFKANSDAPILRRLRSSQEVRAFVQSIDCP